MKTVRVLHIMDKVSVDGSNIQGPARQLAYRAPFYKNHHVETLLCNLRAEASACDILRRNNVDVVSLGRGKFDVFVIRDLQKLVDTWEPDIIHLSGYAAWTFGRMLKRKNNKVDIVLQEHFVDLKMPFYQKILDWILKGKPSRGLAVSNSVKEFMSRERYIHPEKIRVIGNGIPTSQMTAPSDEELEDLRGRYNIKAGSIIIGNLARLATMKGQRYFIESAAEILKSRDNTCFIIVGEGPLETDLKQLANELGVLDNIIFAGYQENVYPFLKLFDVTVIASIYGEGFCSVGIESFSVETPLVITEHALVEDVYIDRDNCLVVPTGNSREMARAVLEILDDDISDKLIQGGLRMIRKCDSEIVAGNYCNFYNELLNGNDG
ncbi:MAG: glycosyltransferase family 4 protein [Pseudomonadota bacterium]